ncbi:DUF2268 domain-containing protein [candidate division KSB1 bacterium]|nr:DUF2268 domain-containing protein [candidate division KSB1 bacterium]
MTGNILKLPILCGLLFQIWFCSSPQNQQVLNQDDVFIIDSLRTNKICFHRNMSLVDSAHYPQIIKSIKLGIDTTSKVMDVTDVEFRVLVFPSKTIPRIGMSGAAPNDRQIYILLDPAHPKFDEAISTHIVQTIPHEYHHTLRYRTVGYGNNLFESMISEGLACHFAIDVCKIDTPFYCKALTDEQFKAWKTKAAKIWFNPEYDHLEWFVGLKKTIPANTGYTIGFSMVSDYLKNHPGETAASLYDTPADKFLEQR